MMSDDSRQCYICLDDEGGEDEWVSPCKCSGSLKWVHQRCLIRWVREHEANRPWSPASCPQCRTRLKLVPEKGFLVSTLEFIDTTVYPACKYMTGWFFGLIAFDTAGSIIGILARSQVYGLDETLDYMTKFPKIECMMRLHLTTFSLVFVNAFPWEKYLLNGLRRLSRLPLARWILPEEIPARYRLPYQTSVSQIVVNSALLPFVGRLVGGLCFSSVNSYLDRVLFGGLTFLAVKGVLSMYVLHQQELRRKRMTISPFQASIRPSITN